jgi:hypothetical protein
MLTVLLTILAGCSTTASTTVSVCALEVTALAPVEAAAGETVVMTASPTTTVLDSAVTVGGHRADILDITRESCESCDACRSVNGCLACGDCDSCDLACENTCVETVTFTVPAESVAGAAGVQLFNAYGVSESISLTVLSATSDTGGGDTGAGKDTGTDSGR